MEIKKIKERRYYPMSVSGKGANDPVESELLDSVWKKFDTLSPENKERINSYEIANKILELQKKFLLSDDQIAFVSLLVRQRFFGEINADGCVQRLREKIPQQQIGDEAIKNMVAFLENEVLTVTLLPESKNNSDNAITLSKGMVKLPLLKALAEYPRLNDQPITGEKIRVKNQPEAVRPSLGNWIRYYRDELGIGFHDQVTRGKFLFQSENGKRLNNEERERINLVLKSLEEEFPLDIDTERSMIVFPVRTQPSPVSSTFPVHREMAVPARPTKPFQVASVPPVAPSVAPASIPTSVQVPKSSFFGNTFGPAKNVAGDTLHFSTGHVLPGEKETQAALAATPSIPTTLQPSVAPAQPPTPAFNVASINRNRGSTLPRSPYSIRPLRLREDANDGEGNQ